MALLLISLLAGVLTVLAPCTLTLLPVIVGGTAGGAASLRRTLVVTLSLGVSVIVFTFLLKVSTVFLSLPEAIWRDISGGIIIALGLAMLFPTLWERIPLIGKINQRSNVAIGAGYRKQNIAGDLLVGAALGPVFSSCSPTYFLILAEVLPRSIGEGLVYLFAYVIGLCGTLLLAALLGQRFLERTGFAADPKGTLKRGVGVLFLILGLAIISGYDKKAELFFAEHVFDVTKIELALLLPQKSALAEDPLLVSSSTPERIAAKEKRYVRAPEIGKPSGFINTDGKEITIGELKGKKVVLVDFWTYSCINCIRTLPYLKSWNERYRDQGLEIIGVHTPEFAFEQVRSNVQDAVDRFGIRYPVVMDNEYGTWSAFQNHYWPHVFLIDIDGFVVYDHIGEGNDEETEDAIRSALKERARVLGETEHVVETPVSTTDTAAIDYGSVKSPETYFGSARNAFLGNGTPGVSGTQVFSLPKRMKAHVLYLGGAWNVAQEYAATSERGAVISYTYEAKDVYMVASARDGAHLRVTLDGNTLEGVAGADANALGDVSVSGQRLYHLIQGASYGTHVLRIEVVEGTLEAYTFTFG